MLLAPIAPQSLAPAIKDTAFLMLNGKDDPWGTVEEVQALYKLVGSLTKELVFYDSGHRLPSDFVDRALGWFRQHL